MYFLLPRGHPGQAVICLHADVLGSRFGRRNRAERFVHCILVNYCTAEDVYIGRVEGAAAG